MLHGNNPTHSIKQCHTIKKKQKTQKSCKNGDRKNTKHRYYPSKEEIQALAAFSKETMVKEYKNVNKELRNFENMSMSGG